VALGLDASVLENTVEGFNRAVRPGTFDPGALDSCATEGLDPPKSHWAVAIDRPPFSAYSLRPGITFTYLGVEVDGDARIFLATGEPTKNLYAAGEIMAGNI